MNTHPLRAWRRKNGITPLQIEAETGVSPTHLSQIETGKKGLSLPKAVRIERYTQGAVPASAMLPAPKQDAGPAAT